MFDRNQDAWAGMGCRCHVTDRLSVPVLITLILQVSWPPKLAVSCVPVGRFLFLGSESGAELRVSLVR